MRSSAQPWRCWITFAGRAADGLGEGCSVRESEVPGLAVAAGSPDCALECGDAGGACGTDVAPTGARVSGPEQPIRPAAASVTTIAPAMLRRRPAIMSSRYGAADPAHQVSVRPFRSITARP